MSFMLTECHNEAHNYVTIMTNVVTLSVVAPSFPLLLATLSFLEEMMWWNKESVILKTYLKYFSLEKYIGVCRKEDILKHATSLTS